MGSAQSIGDDARLLYDASRRGDTAELARLARLGAGLEWRDSKGRTPLIAAAALSKRAIVEQLLTLGADVHAVGATRDVGSALHVAATAGDHATAEVLLAALASPFLVHHGATPLDAAAAAGDVHMCRRLESLSLFAGWVYERRPPGLIDTALGRERWERRYVCVAPRYSAPTPPATDVLCALQLRIMRRDVDAAPIETYFLHAARMVPAPSGLTLEVFVPDLLAIQHTPNAQRIITFSCTPPGVFPPEGGSTAVAAQRLNALLAACTSRAPPRVPMPRRNAAAPGVNVAAFPSPPPSTAGGEVAPAVQLAWLGTQPAPRTNRSGAPEAERSWPAALQLRVSMPLLTRAGDVTVAVTGQELNLHAPGKYRLRAALPYPIAADVAAVFDADRRELNLSCTVLCVPRDPPQQPAQQPQAGPSAAAAPPPPPLPPRPARAPDGDTDADLEEAIRRSLADVAAPPPPPPPPGAVPPPSAPPLPTAAPPAAPAPPSAPPASTASADDEASLCIICMTDKRTVGLLHGSSMHVVACAGCAPHLRAKPCPMCRAPVERLVENIYS